MDIMEILSDALIYPTKNITALAIYLALALVSGLVIGLTGLGTVFAGKTNVFASYGIAFLGLVLTLIIGLLIDGFALDIIKYGINRSDDAPAIDFVRQTVNGFKLLVVQIVYFIIPLIITILARFIFNKWVTLVIAVILFVIFGLAHTMAICKLAQTDNLYDALNIGDAIEDISRVVTIKLIMTILDIAIIAFIIAAIILGISGAIFSSTISAIITCIVGVYLLFFSNRAVGLVYSDM